MSFHPPTYLPSFDRCFQLRPLLFPNAVSTSIVTNLDSRTADPYARLRVPKYQKAFESIFFASFLALYYAVLVQRNQTYITPIEILLYIWIAAFAYDEFGEYWDAGYLFYQ